MIEKEGKYLYCIIESAQPQSFGPLGIGQRGDELYSICFNDIAAVVSNSPIKKYPVSSDNTFAHAKAVEEVMKEYSVLPVRYCTITSDEEKVRKILEEEYNRFRDLLDKFKNKKELGLKAIFKEDVVYKEILEENKDIRELKEVIVSKLFKETYLQRREIGRMVEQALEKEKEKTKEDILGLLEPLSEDRKINNTYGERMIINAAFLVDKDNEDKFDKAVEQLYAKYADKIRFKYLGIVPPFNFVNLVIEIGKY